MATITAVMSCEFLSRSWPWLVWKKPLEGGKEIKTWWYFLVTPQLETHINDPLELVCPSFREQCSYSQINESDVASKFSAGSSFQLAAAVTCSDVSLPQTANHVIFFSILITPLQPSFLSQLSQFSVPDVVLVADVSINYTANIEVCISTWTQNYVIWSHTQCLLKHPAEIQVHVFRVVTPCSAVVGYQRFRALWRQHGPLKRWYPTTTLHGVTTPKTSWRWRQHGPLKRWYLNTTLHGVTTQKTSTWIFTTVKASNLSPRWNI
jgi:hypothetical protein